MKVRDIEFNQMEALLNDPHADWEAAGLGVSGVAYPTGEDLFKTGSFENAGGYSDPTMDKLINESTDQPGLQGLYDYESYVNAQQPVIFQETAAVTLLVNNRLRGAAHFTDPLYNYYFENLSCPVAEGNAP
jgi:peptide/nickel transport system substrate-binding protein